LPFRRRTTDRAPRPKLPLVELSMWRQVHPSDPTQFYSKASAAWVRSGWTTYHYDEWKNKFGKRGSFLTPRTFLDDDGRHWQWYATRILVFDENERL